MSESRRLPDRPDLRHLRDEAKARRRAGEFPSLALAHLAIAREHGFVSWPRLKFHIEAVSLDVAERAAALVRSACSGDVRRARALLEADPDLAGYDLACACVSGDQAAAAAILAREPALASRVTGPLEREPILYACFSRLLRTMPDRAPGIRAVARLLLDAGADPNAHYLQGEWIQKTVYGAAGIAGDAELTAMLIEAGADPNDDDPVHTVGEALYHACELGDPTCARLLIDAGTKPDVVSYCLGRVLNFPDEAMALMFCAHGARAHGDHLQQAIMRRRSPATVTALLAAGAPVDAPDEDGVTPLRWAVRWGADELAAILREHGADPAVVTDEDRRTGALLRGDARDAPDAAAGDASAPAATLDAMLDTAIAQGNLEAARTLLDAGADVDQGPGDGDSPPLGQACWRGQVAVARELVARGAALQFADGSAIGAALHGSRHCHNPEGGPTMQTREEIDPAPYAALVRMLLAAGAEVPHEVDGRRSVTLLAELGVDPPA